MPFHDPNENVLLPKMVMIAIISHRIQQTQNPTKLLFLAATYRKGT